MPCRNNLAIGYNTAILNLHKATSPIAHDTDILTGVSIDELEALAAGVLAPAAQSRLDELLLRLKQHQLSTNEECELDNLLHKVDQLNLLKARARYTIDHLSAKVSGT